MTQRLDRTDPLYSDLRRGVLAGWYLATNGKWGNPSDAELHQAIMQAYDDILQDRQ